MMKTVLYTQRVEIVEFYGETRDCADRRIPCFINECGYLPVPLPCITDIAITMVKQLSPAGIVLTGGNSLAKYGGDAPERDEMEKKLLDVAVNDRIPVYGFCRGMQVILDYFGCKLTSIGGHIATRHKISGNTSIEEVNSFHSQGCMEVTDSLELLAYAEDGVIESIRHKEYPVFATMWHPEREMVFREQDIKQVQQLFGSYK